MYSPQSCSRRALSLHMRSTLAASRNRPRFSKVSARLWATEIAEPSKGQVAKGRASTYVEADQDVPVGIVVDCRIGAAHEGLGEYQGKAVCGIEFGEGRRRGGDVHVTEGVAAHECVIARRVDDVRKVLAGVL